MVVPLFSQLRRGVNLQSHRNQLRLADDGRRYFSLDACIAVASFFDRKGEILTDRNLNKNAGGAQRFPTAIEDLGAFRSAYHLKHSDLQRNRFENRINGLHPVAILERYPTCPADKSGQNQGRHPHGKSALPAALPTLETPQGIRQVGSGGDFSLGNPRFANVADDFVQLQPALPIRPLGNHVRQFGKRHPVFSRCDFIQHLAQAINVRLR